MFIEQTLREREHCKGGLRPSSFGSFSFSYMSEMRFSCRYPCAHATDVAVVAGSGGKRAEELDKAEDSPSIPTHVGTSKMKVAGDTEDERLG